MKVKNIRDVKQERLEEKYWRSKIKAVMLLKSIFSHIFIDIILCM